MSKSARLASAMIVPFAIHCVGRLIFQKIIHPLCETDLKSEIELNRLNSIVCLVMQISRQP